MPHFKGAAEVVVGGVEARERRERKICEEREGGRRRSREGENEM